MGRCEKRQVDVWVHAVSLGEVMAAIPLIDALLEKGRTVLVTTLTPTGSARVQSYYGNKVAHRYLPYDLPVVVTRFIAREKPKVLLIMETELWPNLIHYAHKAHIPIFLANARLSEASFKGYIRFKFFFKTLLKQFTMICAQSREDANRLIALGAEEDKVCVLGNIKFDIQTHAVDDAPFLDLKKRWGDARVVFIAASTHEGEESMILSELRRLQAAMPKVILLMAPRHPERFKPVHQLATDLGFNTGLRSDLSSLSFDNEVVVLDSLGELLGFYGLSDFAFVGGSLVPVGGHNVLEPIVVHVPVFSGTYVHHFKAIVRDLQEAEAIQLVDNAAQLVDGLIRLYQDPELKKRMVHQALVVLNKNKGALLEHLALIEGALSTP